MQSFQPRRSALYVPGSNERALEKAFSLDADVLILDLEDAVAPSAKAEARARVAACLAGRSGTNGPERVVRINALDGEWGAADLAALADTAPDAILLPKVSTPADVDRARAALSGTALGERVSLWAMIETPRAVLDPLSIALAQESGPPLAALVLGLNDLSRETGTRQVPGRLPMLPWMMSALAAARAGGIAILDGVFIDLADAESFAAECRQARDCGFDGKTVVHPSQIGPCNAAFSPTAAELEAAERVVAAYAAALAEGRGVATVDGRMVEALHAEQARQRLDLAAAIARNRDRPATITEP